MNGATRILIVDDDIISRSLMSAELEGDGFAVLEAGDGEEALRIYEAATPELLVVDAVMPVMDGFGLCRELRKHPRSAYVPILMATGLDDAPSIAMAYEAGATDFIAKPLKRPMLAHRVRYMLRAARAFEELRYNQERLIAAKEAAEAANRTKTEFLANMSHELRTPLNAIIGFATIMRDGTFGPLAPRYAEYSRVITESGTHLLAIINDILDLARAEAARLVLAEDEVELAEVIEASAGTIDGMAKSAGVECRIALPPAPPWVRGDRGKLRQVLVNLLSNAVKFTPAGGSVALSAEIEAAGDLVLRIADTGIGIPADKIAVALAPFGQVDSGLARKYEGVGLGLPLAKRLIELHDGSMAIESEPGRGTTVTMRLPATRICPPVPEAIASSA